MREFSYVKQWVSGHKINRSVWCPAAGLLVLLLTLVLGACGASTISSGDTNTLAQVAAATVTTATPSSSAVVSPTNSNHSNTITLLNPTTTAKVDTTTANYTPPPETTIIIDWVHFIKFGGVTYITSTNLQDLKVEIGPEFAQVKFQLNGNVSDPQYQSKDGDAAYLAVGTPIYTVKGYKPEFRLAARESDNTWQLYEADTNPNAKVGLDLLDISGKVQYIAINSPIDAGTTEIAAIKDTKQIASLVDIVLRSPVDQNLMPASTIRYFIAFHLHDGTVLNRAYWPDTGELFRGIILPKAFRTAIEQAIKTVSTATVAAPANTYLQPSLTTQTAPNVATKPIAQDSSLPIVSPTSVLITTFKGDNFITITDRKQLLDLSWSPDGKIIASTTATGIPGGYKVQWRSTENGKEIPLPPYLTDIFGFKWLPNGRMLTLGPSSCQPGNNCDKRLRLWSAEGKLITDFSYISPNYTNMQQISWSPDLKYLAAYSDFHSTESKVWLWSMDGKLVTTLANSSGPFAWSPDSKILATSYTSYNQPNNPCAGNTTSINGVQLWNVEGKSLATVCGYSSPVETLAWSPDGSIFATSSEDAIIKNNTRTQGLVRLISRDGQDKGKFAMSVPFITNLAWSPNGQVLAVTARNGCSDCIGISNGSDGGVLELWTATGKQLTSVTNSSYILAWSPDGKMLASTAYLPEETGTTPTNLEVNARIIKLWSADGKLLNTLTVHTQPITKLVWSPDGQILASASSDGTVKLWK